MKTRYALILLCFITVTCTAQAQMTAQQFRNELARDRQSQRETQRQIQEHHAIVRHMTGADRIDQADAEDQFRQAMADNARAAARAKAWRRTHRAAAAAKNHPVKPPTRSPQK